LLFRIDTNIGVKISAIFYFYAVCHRFDHIKTALKSIAKKPNFPIERKRRKIKTKRKLKRRREEEEAEEERVYALLTHPTTSPIRHLLSIPVGR